MGDIAIYVKALLCKVHEDNDDDAAEMGPLESELSKLIAQSGTLFIYAATAIRYIMDGDALYKSRLSVLTQETKPGGRQIPGIDGLYAHILQQACHGWEEDEINHMRDILSIIIFLRTPLSIQAVKSLAGLNVSQYLSRLTSVVHLLSKKWISSTVAPLHTSFPDFVTDHARCSPAYCPAFAALVAAECHELLALKCLELMNRSLQYNRPEELTLRGQNSPEYIPEVLKYSCIHWVSHVMEVPTPCTELITALLVFFCTHLLQWMDCMTVLHQLLMVPKSLESLSLTISDLALKGTDRCYELHDLVVDSYQSLQQNLKFIEASTEAASTNCSRSLGPYTGGPPQQVAFRDQYQQLGDLKDLEAALRRGGEAVHLTPEDHPERPGCLQGLAISFNHRYQRLGDLRDLEVAIQIFQEAMVLTPRDHPDKAQHLKALAESLRDRYQRLGELRDLEATMQTFQEAVELTPVDHLERPTHLQGLAGSLTDQYQRLGDLRDLEAAIQNFHEAIDLTPSYHSRLPGLLQGLAGSLTDRYQRLGDLRDLEAAIQKFQKAIDLTSTYHSELPRRLQGLAVSSRDQYRRLGDLGDLEAALSKGVEAVDLTPAGNPDRPHYLQSLAVSFRDRYQRLGDLMDLEAAIQNSQEAAELTPMDHPDRPGYLQNLALSFTDRYGRLGESKDLKDIQHYYATSFETPTLNNPELSWRAALDWASFSQEFQPVAVIAAYQAAFHLLPKILWMGNNILVWCDAIRRLDIGLVVSTAIKCCIKLGHLRFAVEILEQGLGIIFQQMLQLKPNFDHLSPHQAEELQKLSYELYSGTAVNPRKVAARREELLDDIHNQPGFEYFLLPKPYSVLCHAAQRGPVVILNSHADGCDAIIILNSIAEPVHLPLPSVTFNQLRSKQEMLMNLRGSEGDLDHLLSWLWKNVVEPVYQGLALHGIHQGRLWWLPSGSFTGLPLHACPPTNQFIHSYTATLGSLLKAQVKASNMLKVAVVGVTHTGPHRENYLPGVEKEVQTICSIIPNHTLHFLEGDMQLQMLSCFNSRTAPGFIWPVMQTRIGLFQPRVACYCQTVMGDTELANESFHLSGGLIAAGFRSAVGALWAINDEDAALIVKAFYF
ncbi:hypothetical protein DFH07DRAFT_773779 [Mycena maculata]|uniref:CHAT domain-containing protein n=1 Tax=Mycena maculata TaxID=230809 RepID=A0AAD7J0M8_9AGAR|nr:hypothetical protein DFH07DRAFT_773779 [Mycena maculata]